MIVKKYDQLLILQDMAHSIVWNHLLVYLECSKYFFRIRILSTSHGVGGVFSGSHTSLSTFDTVQIGQKSCCIVYIKLGKIKKKPDYV